MCGLQRSKERHLFQGLEDACLHIVRKATRPLLAISVPRREAGTPDVGYAILSSRGEETEAVIDRSAIILQDLYDSEINFSIVTFWDNGFEVKLGDDLNGFVASAHAAQFANAVEWLMVRAIEKYPDSLFAKTYR
jgi:hypothetical protein